MGKGCIETGKTYGASAAAVAAPLARVDGGATAVALAPVIGGIYGCLASDQGQKALQEIWSETKTAWRVTRRVLWRAWRWVDPPRGRRFLRVEPLSMDDALALVAHSFEHKIGPRLYLPRGDKWVAIEASSVITQDVIAQVYGPDLAGIASPGALVNLWWRFWAKTEDDQPDWSARTRLLFTIFRVGDFLASAPEGLDIEAWPTLPRGEALATLPSHPAAVMVKTPEPETGQSIQWRGKTPPEASLWLFAADIGRVP